MFLFWLVVFGFFVFFVLFLFVYVDLSKFSFHCFKFGHDCMEVFTLQSLNQCIYQYLVDVLLTFGD